jgi:shikimate kinase/3-dehydroquinate synthase
MPAPGKSSIGRRLARGSACPFLDADAEIEAAAACPSPRSSPATARRISGDGERRVIARLVAGPAGGARHRRRRLRRRRHPRGAAAHGAVTVWLKCRHATLLRRVWGAGTGPCSSGTDPAEVLHRLMAARHPLYAEADIVIPCTDESPDATTRRVQEALAGWTPPARCPSLDGRGYDVVVGEGLLRAPAPFSRRRCRRAASLWCPTRRWRRCTGRRCGPGWRKAGFDRRRRGGGAAGRGEQELRNAARVLEELLAAGIDRRTTVVALGGGVVGDLAGFAAAVALRGLPFVQVPTTLLAQVDSSVGGKTGVNLRAGKNLAGAFHQPRMVLADTGTLRTLPPRELRAGYAEVAKHGLIAGEAFWGWCEANGAALVRGDPAALAHAVVESCRLKAAVVAADEREESPEGGRALLNLGHTFGHALEAERGFDGSLLHGEAVGVGLGLAASLSARLGHCSQELPGRVISHLAACDLPARIADLGRGFGVAALMGRMRKDKKVRDGALRFVLLRGPGEAFTAGDVPAGAVEALLRDEGCAA